MTTATQSLSVPTIHLNGTSREALLQQYTEALEALTTALEKLRQAAPHPRDYYVQDGDTFPRARQEHDDRLRALETVHDELQAVAEAIA